MSSQSKRKTPWSLRFAKLRVNFILGADMKLWQYDSRELLNAAEMAYWMNDLKFAQHLMEEIALRIMEEHPPDGERLESEIEEVSEKEGSSLEAAEADYDGYCYRRGEN